MKQCAAWFLMLAMMFSCLSACADDMLTEELSKIDLSEAREKIPTVLIYADSLVGWKDKQDVREATLYFSDPVTGYSFEDIITIRPQGTSSMSYPKKNFTIEFQTGDVEIRPEWDYQTEYCLKANYIDPTHACNVVSARLAAQCYELLGLHEDLPNRGAVDGFPVWVVLNDFPVGLYTWNIPKAPWMLGMDEDDENHIVMAGEAHTEGAKFLQDYYELDEEWSIEIGPNTSRTITTFSRLIDFIANSTDEEFVENFDQYLNLDACLLYYCYICISNAGDNMAKNMLMTTWDGEVWYPMLYDLDSLWGVKWEGQTEWADKNQELLKTDHRLYQRLRDCFGPELRECYAALRDGPLSIENIWAEFEAFKQGIPEEMLLWDSMMWHSDGKMIRTYEVMDRLMQEYLPQTDAAFGYVCDQYSRP